MYARTLHTPILPTMTRPPPRHSPPRRTNALTVIIFTRLCLVAFAEAAVSLPVLSGAGMLGPLPEKRSTMRGARGGGLRISARANALRPLVPLAAFISLLGSVLFDAPQVYSAPYRLSREA